MNRIDEWVMDGTDEQDAYAIRNPLLIGDENMGEFWTEHGNVARTFRGQYTIVEIRALLADMVRVQQNLDAARAAAASLAATAGSSCAQFIALRRMRLTSAGTRSTRP